MLYGMSEIPGDILQPFVTLVMPVDKGHLYKFVQTDKEINPHRRKLQQKGADKAQWNCEQPHINKVTEKSPSGITAGAEDTADDRGIHGLSQYIVHIDIEHGVQISLRSGSQVSHVHKQGTQKEDNDSPYDSADKRDLAEPCGVLLHSIHKSRAYGFAKQDGTGIGKAKADHSTQISGYNDHGVGSHHVAAQMSHDHRVHGKRHTPGDLIAKGRKGIADKIFKEEFMALYDRFGPETYGFKTAGI